MNSPSQYPTAMPNDDSVISILDTPSLSPTISPTTLKETINSTQLNSRLFLFFFVVFFFSDFFLCVCMFFFCLYDTLCTYGCRRMVSFDHSYCEQKDPKKNTQKKMCYKMYFKLSKKNETHTHTHTHTHTQYDATKKITHFVLKKKHA